MVVAHRDGDAVGAHATLRQAGHQSTEASQGTMWHALARGVIAERRRVAVMPRYERGHELLRQWSSARRCRHPFIEPNRLTVSAYLGAVLAMCDLGGALPRGGLRPKVRRT